MRKDAMRNRVGETSVPSRDGRARKRMHHSTREGGRGEERFMCSVV